MFAEHLSSGAFLYVTDFVLIGPIKDNLLIVQNLMITSLHALMVSETQENILYQTNLYIIQSMKATPNVTLPELFSFLGINMIMEYHVLPS